MTNYQHLEIEAPRRGALVVAEPARGAQRLQRRADRRHFRGVRRRRSVGRHPRGGGGGARAGVLRRRGSQLDALDGGLQPRRQSRRRAQGGAHVPRRAFLLAAGHRARAGRCLWRRRRPRGGLRHRHRRGLGRTSGCPKCGWASSPPPSRRTWCAPWARARRRVTCSPRRSFRPRRRRTLGLVHEITKANGLDVEVERQAQVLLSSSPAALAATKRLLADVVEAPAGRRAARGHRQVHRRCARVARRARRHRAPSSKSARRPGCRRSSSCPASSGNC